ncbi:type I restriction enzyme endonuclease domain-containing protein [Nostoc sp.]|uniref:type I restriction enzyme endonuclease domain-containing protein n=1 Tax=Nostoc sp. TaxID=1180 RepID=UPI002FFC6FC5
MVDIFAAAGVENPDISILSDEFLADVRQLPQRHLALELINQRRNLTNILSLYNNST